MQILIYATLVVAKLEFERSFYSLKEERKKKKEEWWARHSLVQTNFAREKGLRANLLSLLHLFLLSPKSLLCNTFRGPHFFATL